MDYNKFFTGLGFLIAGYVMYRLARYSKVRTEETGIEGTSFQNLFGIWVSAILGIIIGIVYLLKSL